MDWSFLLSVALFAVVMTGTPGPNNVMLTASGANFGYVRSIPHFLGIGLGLISLILLNGAGLGVIFQTYPMVQEVLKWLGSAICCTWLGEFSLLGSTRENPIAKPNL